MIRFALLLVMAVAVAAPVFMAARGRAQQSAGARIRGIVLGAVGTSGGLLLSLWLPSRVKPTEGSPASLVLIVLLWVLGGGFAYLSAAMLLGAATAMVSPASADPSSNQV